MRVYTLEGMTLFTSSQFASASATGTDWRDTAKAVLETLNEARADHNFFNFGFLYISDALAGDASSILNLFSSVLSIENWAGTVGIGVCGTGQSYVDEPAISAMIGRFEEGSFCTFPAGDAEDDKNLSKLKAWLEKTDPMLIYTHGDPLSETDPAQTLQDFESTFGGFLVGGLSSSRHNHVQFSGSEVLQNGICGVAFSQDIPVATTLSQGCRIIGTAHRITEGHDFTIHKLDDEKAVAVFENDLRSMAIKKMDVDPNTVVLDEAALSDKSKIPEEFHALLKGEVHAAFPIAQSDLNDYLVRNIIGIDPEDGSISVAHTVSPGESILFVHRDDDSVSEDLSKTLVALRERVTKDHGQFEPKGALYISCVARAFSDDPDHHKEELQIIRNIIGDIPLAGFYAGGEINNARLYGYTGILTLFL